MTISTTAKQNIKVIVIGVALVSLIFFTGFGVGRCSVENQYKHQTEIIQKIKSLVSGV